MAVFSNFDAPKQRVFRAFVLRGHRRQGLLGKLAGRSCMCFEVS
jgi:hypothetical protein